MTGSAYGIFKGVRDTLSAALPQEYQHLGAHFYSERPAVHPFPAIQMTVTSFKPLFLGQTLIEFFLKIMSRYKGDQEISRCVENVRSVLEGKKISLSTYSYGWVKCQQSLSLYQEKEEQRLAQLQYQMKVYTRYE